MHTLTREREADLSYHTSSEEVALIPKRLSMPHENEQWPISSGSRNCRVSISVHHCLRRKLACLPSSTKHDRVSTRRASLYMLPLCAKLMRVSRSSNICLQQLRYVRRGHLCSQALSFFLVWDCFFLFLLSFFSQSLSFWLLSLPLLPCLLLLVFLPTSSIPRFPFLRPRRRQHLSDQATRAANHRSQTLSAFLFFFKKATSHEIKNSTRTK